MKKAILMPDSFKGTMSSSEICAIMRARILEYFPDCEVSSIPVADGGEGTVDCFLEAMGGERVTVAVKGPFMEDIEGFYAIVNNGQTAIIEMAAAASLPMVAGREDPRVTTTYGVGQLIRDAVNRGCKRLIIGLGGSCTNDMGAGAAAGAGVKFYNAQGKEFVPTGATLAEIAKIDVTAVRELLNGIEVVAMCDIDNPLYGPTGAAYVFAPQKGADADMVKLLDANLAAAAQTVKAQLGVNVADMPGAGAAGGMGAGMVAFFGARLMPGIETVLDTVEFERIAADADVIFTGEGRIDSQSLRGKVVIGIAGRAKKVGVPVIAVVGDIGDNMEPAYEMGVSCIFSTNRVAVDFSKAKPRAKSDMSLTVDTVLRTLKLGAGMK
ncbi:MAG: glycerate kinase [Clostridia bacterium]|nr:glycerate kinase [Clostridia bacterium]